MKKKRKIVAFLSSDLDIERNAQWNAAFWKNVPDEQKFSAGWKMVETAWEIKGKNRNELRLARTVGLFKPA